jgi:hypothetical protein
MQRKAYEAHQTVGGSPERTRSTLSGFAVSKSQEPASKPATSGFQGTKRAFSEKEFGL